MEREIFFSFERDIIVETALDEEVSIVVGLVLAGCITLEDLTIGVSSFLWTLLRYNRRMALAASFKLPSLEIFVRVEIIILGCGRVESRI
jgi:hypothetical protein